MSSSLANRMPPASPADRREPAGRRAQAEAQAVAKAQAQAQGQPTAQRSPSTEWPRPPGFGSVAWFDLHEQARAQAQALRREAMVQAWAEVDRAWAATHRSAGRAARRLAQRLRHHWQRRDNAPAQQA